jgi:hypothetical protein
MVWFGLVGIRYHARAVAGGVVYRETVANPILEQETRQSCSPLLTAVVTGLNIF